MKDVLKVSLEVIYRVELGREITRWEGCLRYHHGVDGIRCDEAVNKENGNALPNTFSNNN